MKKIFNSVNSNNSIKSAFPRAREWVSTFANWVSHWVFPFRSANRVVDVKGFYVFLFSLKTFLEKKKEKERIKIYKKNREQKRKTYEHFQTIFANEFNQINHQTNQ